MLSVANLVGKGHDAEVAERLHNLIWSSRRNFYRY